jgi:thiol-disulfide isomerase/thioredoxin
MKKVVILRNSCFYIAVSFMFVYHVACNDQSKPGKLSEKAKQIQIESLDKHIGERFNISMLTDTSGNPVEIDFGAAEITIIDFWINECPPCNKEMSQFKKLIEGKEKEITIISISVSSYDFWKKLFVEKSERYAFLTTQLPNWLHLNMKSNESSSLNNPISTDRLDEIANKLSVSFFPSYFVIDKSGRIIARPISAVEYIQKLDL